MMISEENNQSCYIWIWLPDETEPVVAGKLFEENGRLLFTYGQRYLSRENAISLYDEELPLRPGIQEKKGGIESIPGSIRDSAPDAWGRRVILNKLLGARSKNLDPGSINELTYLMESGSDRVGALDFQSSASHFVPRLSGQVSLGELLKAAELVEQGIPLTDELRRIVFHGTSIGGARPKAVLDSDHLKYIAKFSSSTDHYNIIKAEFVAMRLAKRCGLQVANVQLTKSLGKDVLLVERFDRVRKGNAFTRKMMISALTLLGLEEMTAHYASYEDFAEIIRRRFNYPKETLQELFKRLVFNILCGNTDDHARNHAAFWDGKHLDLTPAYDICPQLRHGGEATQAMLITGSDKTSRLVTCLKSANQFMLSDTKARAIIQEITEGIKNHWEPVCKEAMLSQVEKNIFTTHMFLNAYAFDRFTAE